ARGHRRHPKTRRARLGEFAIDIHQAGHHPLTDGRCLDPRQLEAKRIDDVRALWRRLTGKEEARLGVVLSKSFRLAPQLAGLWLHLVGERDESLRASLERGAPAERVWFVRHAAAA